MIGVAILFHPPQVVAWNLGDHANATVTTMLRAEWVVAMTEPMREFYAASHLRRTGNKYYLPVTYDHRTAQRLPLFRPYMFIHCPNRAVGDLTCVSGVSRILMAAAVPLMIPNEFIKSLRAKENENGVIHLDGVGPKPKKKYPVFKRGDCVRLNNNAFASLSVLYDQPCAHERARVLMEWLGHLVPVTVPIEQIEPA